jgi:glycerol-3-phosphate acyltransferase PlsX
MGSRVVTIALDAMGGDHAPDHAVEAAVYACKKHASLHLQLFGQEGRLEPLLARLLTGCSHLRERITIMHADHAIADDEKPSTALRASKQSSMRLAIEAVKEGRADAVVSAGNTGALMAISKLILRTLPLIDRPAIVALLPTIRGSSVMLDLGANAESTSENLLQFAIMGNAFAKAALRLESPTIGLLNIGSEDVKGNDVVRSAAQLIRDSAVLSSFHGYVEGNDIAAGTVDVVVTDGFSGNIALKTAEGTAKFCKQVIKQGFGGSLLAQLGGLLARSALKKAGERLDHRNYNGAMLVGLNGVVVKSHGSADMVAFANAIQVTYSLVERGVNQEIMREINTL